MILLNKICLCIHTCMCMYACIYPLFMFKNLCQKEENFLYIQMKYLRGLVNLQNLNDATQTYTQYNERNDTFKIKNWRNERVSGRKTKIETKI